MTQILIDENIPRDVKEWLIKKGFDTISVSQTHLKSAQDYALAEYASKHNLLIITLDQGFAKIYRIFQKGTLSVIIIKAKPATSANIIETMNAAQQKINLKEIQHKLIIITKKKIRIITSNPILTKN